MLQLHLLRESWQKLGLRAAWVTLEREDAYTLLAGEDVTFAHGPTTRSVTNLCRNLLLAWRLVRRRRPRVIITTGAGIAVPFSWVGRLFGASTVYVESLTRVERPSLSCRLVRPIADRVYGQWPELESPRWGLRYAGQVVERP